MAGQRKGSTLNFFHFNTDEKTGICKLLEKCGKDISLCGVKTRKPEFHYCFDCYQMIKTLFGLEETKVWPPERAGNESRYCYDYDRENCFLIPHKWMKEYEHIREPQVAISSEFKSKNMGTYIDIEVERFQSKKGGLYPCYVYLFRMKNNVIYVGECKDYAIRLKGHKNNPGSTITKHGGFKKEIYHVKVKNRILAEELEQFLVNALNASGVSATNAKNLH